MRGIVACEALYHLVERFAPDAAVRYVPAELHEFPVNVPLEDEIGTRVQAAVDELDGPDRDAVVVSYAMDDATRAALRTAHADLVVSTEPDCVSTVLPAEPQGYGETKAPGTLYLTRGWIDCGVDSYKLYRAYRADLDDLVARFEAAAGRHPDLRYSWPDGERFAKARKRDGAVADGPADSFFRSIAGYYDRIALVDTGDLYAVHRDYAELVRNFVADLRAQGPDRPPVELEVVAGETDRFEALIAGTGG